jgi:hypothetical protein
MRSEVKENRKKNGLAGAARWQISDRKSQSVGLELTRSPVFAQS